MSSKDVRTVVWISVGALALMGLLMGTGASAGSTHRGMATLLSPTGVVSNTLSYQGRLLQGSAPINDSRMLMFRLYTDTTSATPLWSQLYSVAVSNGLFNVSLDVDPALFNGQALWLGVQVQGDAQEMAPRQPILPAPYALYAKSAPWSGLINVPPDFADGVDNDSPHFAGPGLNINGTTFSLIPSYRLPQGCANGQIAEWNLGAGEWACGTDDVGGGGAAWLLTGNAGISPTINFLGTTDARPLRLVANGMATLRLEPTYGTANLIGGFDGNAPFMGVNGATISGGGSEGYLNRVTDNFGVVGGGRGNQAGDGDSDPVNGSDATTGGGRGNIASGAAATVGGGLDNTASGYGATVGAGLGNTASVNYATVGGGGSNSADGVAATIGGGLGNTASGNWVTIGGGGYNTASGAAATVPGGYGAEASHYGEMAYASGMFSTEGDAQTSLYVLRGTTTDATQTSLFPAGDGTSERLTIAPGRTLAFEILVVARSNTGASAGYRVRGVIENVGGTTSMIGATGDVLGEDVAAWDAIAVADNANDTLDIRVTGAASTTIRWVAMVRTTEVVW